MVFSVVARSSSAFVLAAALLASLAPAGAAPQQSEAASAAAPRAQAYYHFSLAHLYRNLATQFLHQDYVEKAIEEYNLAIEADPDSSYIRHELIKLYASANRLDDAVAEAETVIARNPEDPEIHRLLAQVYESYARGSSGVNAELAEKALAEYQKAVDLDPGDFDTLVSLSRLQRATGDREAARATLEKALALQPEANEALISLAGLYLEEGEPEEAIDALERANSNDEGRQRRLQLLGAAYESVGRHNDAADALQELVEIVTARGGNTVPVRESLAQNLTLAGRLDEARDEYEALVEAQPRNPDYHLRLAQIHRENRRFSDAWNHLRAARELAPDSLEIEYNTVMLLEAEQRYDEAVEGLEQLLDDTEQDQYGQGERARRAMFLEHLASLQRSREEYDKAVEVYERIGELEPQTLPRVRAMQIDTLRAARRFDEALELSEEAVEEFPDDRGLAVQNASVLAENGRSAEAGEALEKLLDGGPGDLEIYLSLAQVHEKGERFDEAIAAAEKAAELAQTEGARLTVQFTHASILEQAKRYDEAEAKFRELIAEDPDNSSALNYLGYMLADQGVKLDEAHDMIQKALDLEPDNGAYLDSLGWVYYRQDKLQLAERYLLRSLEQYGRDPVVHSHLGDVYHKLGREDDARRHWERGLKEFRASAKADQDPAAMEELREKLAELGVQDVSQADGADNKQERE